MRTLTHLSLNLSVAKSGRCVGVSRSFHPFVRKVNASEYEYIQENVCEVRIALNENILPECFRGVA